MSQKDQPKGKRPKYLSPRMENTCKVCGKTYVTSKYVILKGKSSTCSYPCRGRLPVNPKKGGGCPPTHGGCTKGISSIYRRWWTIKNRCFNPKSDRYHRYGGRGITMCQEWQDSFVSFREWSLANGFEEKLQIDRIDNNGNYEPSNCRWVTPLQNSQNKSNNLKTPGGLSIRDHAKRLGISVAAIYSRLNIRGWSIERATSTPRVSREDLALARGKNGKFLPIKSSS